MQISTHPLYDAAERILTELIAFPSTPGTDGKEILAWVSDYLNDFGLQVHRFPFPPAGQESSGADAPANLFTTIGPQQDGGICLSAHLDVVPAAAENWTYPPFELTIEMGAGNPHTGQSSAGRRLFGRGTTDMKGFAALVLAMVPEWLRQKRSQPIHLAFTLDEESGCRGAPFLIEKSGHRVPRPAAVIVGEPTAMVPVIGHKGGTSCYTKIQGVPAHSSTPAQGASAIYIAGDVINFLRSKADALSRGTARDNRFHPSHSTLSVGTIHGGTARNIIPEECRIVWEIRNLPGERPDEILNELEDFVQNEILSHYRPRFPDVDIKTVITAEYPPLLPDNSSVALQYVRKAGCDAEPKCVTFGTEAGHYQSAGIPAVVWGPGDIAQAHIIDEYIDAQALTTYLDCLTRL
ncbi:MAG: acetylornithine deacetylase [Spirochaetota bacterium]